MNLLDDSIPTFTRGHRLHHDRIRDIWLIQAPERALIADPVATSILRLVDGTHQLGTIIDTLAKAYQAPRDVVANDVQKLLASLIDQKVLTA